MKWGTPFISELLKVAEWPLLETDSYLIQEEKEADSCYEGASW